MIETFADMLAEDGKKNSLGRVNDVIEIVLGDESRLEELYETILHDDAWVRMRAIDAFEKICRQHPGWIKPFVPQIQRKLSLSSQPSIQWHIAQIYGQLELSDSQKARAIEWLFKRIATTEVDWIVAANCMKTLAQFVKNGSVSKSDFIVAAEIQRAHKSNAVVKRANKYISELS